MNLTHASYHMKCHVIYICLLLFLHTHITENLLMLCVGVAAAVPCKQLQKEVQETFAALHEQISWNMLLNATFKCSHTK